MAKQQTKEIKILTPTITFNSPFVRGPVKGVDFSNSVREDFHLERGENNEVVVVSDGITDYQKQIDEQKKNAGLQNILKMQTMRYGTLQNAVVANESKKVYADVSDIPDSVGEQAEYVAKVNADIDKLCKELGLTKDQLLNLTPEKYVEIKNAQAAAAAATTNNEGGNE